MYAAEPIHHLRWLDMSVASLICHWCESKTGWETTMVQARARCRKGLDDTTHKGAQIDDTADLSAPIPRGLRKQVVKSHFPQGEIASRD